MQPHVQLLMLGAPALMPQQQRGQRQRLLWAMQRRQQRAGSS
jgi:hypothetical protein